MKITNIYESLSRIDLCNSAYEFSTDYLGKSRSYFSVLKATNKDANIDALLYLERALFEKVITYSQYKHQVYKAKKDKLDRLQKQVKRIRKEYEYAAQGYTWNEIEDLLKDEI